MLTEVRVTYVQDVQIDIHSSAEFSREIEGSLLLFQVCPFVKIVENAHNSIA